MSDRTIDAIKARERRKAPEPEPKPKRRRPHETDLSRIAWTPVPKDDDGDRD